MYSLDHFFMTLMGGMNNGLYYGLTAFSPNDFTQDNTVDLDQFIESPSLPIAFSEGGDNMHVGIIVPSKFQGYSIYINGFKTNTFQEVINGNVKTMDNTHLEATVYVSTYPYHSPIEIEIK